MISNILSRQEQAGQQSRYSTIYNLKAAANMLNFLTANNIKDMAGLDKKLQSMIEKQFAIRDELKPIERRLKVLDEHISHADNYMQFREINRQYRQQKPKHQANYYEAHHREMTLFEAADRYLKDVMNGKQACRQRHGKRSATS